MSAITVHDSSLPLVEYQGRRVVTFAMIDEVHQRPEGTARVTFNRNLKRFIAGTDFVKVSANEYRMITQGRGKKDPLKVCAYAGHTPKKSPEKITGDVTLVFEFGYLMLVKSFKDDLSWQVQRELVNAYFRPAVGVSPVLIPSLEELETMPLQRAADLLAMADKTSSNRHGQPGSAGMTQRRRELKVLRPAFARIQQLIQLTIPGLEQTEGRAN